MSSITKPMSKKINKEEVDNINYDYTNGTMSIFNKKGLLIYRQVVSEEHFNKTAVKFLKGKNNE